MIRPLHSKTSSLHHSTSRVARTATCSSKTRGTTVLEFALVFPMIVLLFLGFVQLIIFFQSATATELGAFYAGRAFQVYGDRTLSSIDYPNTQAHPLTASDQSIAEAAAERAIFESLAWEQKRVHVDGGFLSMKRSYEDGKHSMYNGSGFGNTKGTVHINFKACSGSNCEQGQGVDILYCLPIIFPGAETIFAGALKEYPCKGEALGREYTGIAITRTALLRREPSAL